MYDTYVTIVGNVLTAPEWRRTKNTGSLVAHFKVASTARRLDRESGQWVDGNSLRVRVNCWRKLAEGVGTSLITGDPVIVVGRLYTRDWTDENNNRRTGYELEAVAVGHDLSRGQSRFTRNRPALSTSAVEDEERAPRIGGEQTEPVPPDQVPVRRDGRDFEDLSPAMPRLVGPGSGHRDPGGAVTGDDELLGADDDLGGTDDPDTGFADAGSFASGVESALRQDGRGGEAASVGGDAASGAAVGGDAASGAAVGGDAAASHTIGGEPTGSGDPTGSGPAGGDPTGSGPAGGDPTGSDLAGGDVAGGGVDLGEDRRGRGRRRGRTAVPV
jgi:single-strand DNA-binding protein